MTENLNSALPEYQTACGGKPQDQTNYPSAIYRGERVDFCTRLLRVFEQDPDPFMAGEVEHLLENE